MHCKRGGVRLGVPGLKLAPGMLWRFEGFIIDMGSFVTRQCVFIVVSGRASMEKQVKKAQELWLASETLKRTIESGESS